MRYRRFGRTELQIPVISCGGMRFQHGWNEEEDTSGESNANVAACVRRSLELGIHHIETARGYGTSEYQLGLVLPDLKREDFLLQTKVGPEKEVGKFVENFEKSMALLKMDYVDLFSMHGINDEESLEAARVCLDTAREWQREGRVRHIGFSTHGPTDIIVKAIQTDEYGYVNLHWFYIQQEKWRAIEEAKQRDMGVFIISPNDKGGLLYQPSAKLSELCAPLHPMVFNGLFCLSRPEVHTLSCGVSRASDFDLHLETAEKLEDAQKLVAPIVARLDGAQSEALGEEWIRTWDQGLPDWQDTPGEINIRVILWLRNLALGLDMVDFGKMRYGLFGSGGAWFPGKPADKVGEVDLSACLRHSPHADVIPAALAEAHELLKGEEQKRLQAGD